MPGLTFPTQEMMESNNNICLTMDQFTRLISAARCSRRSFTSTTITYDGTQDVAKAEEFLTCISLYKSFENISDDDAIMTLPLVLKKDAAIWWSVVKDEVKTWSEFEKRFCQTFAPTKPAYVVYQEIFAYHQNPDEMTEIFLIKKRALFSKLPAPVHNETQQLDMVYGLLNVKIRENIPRDTVTSYDELINAARRVEEQLMLERFDQTTSNQPQIHCNYCRTFEHAQQLCCKRKKETYQCGDGITGHNAVETTNVDISTQVPSPNRPKFSCYGCGAPGVVRSNCTTCANKKNKVNREISFNAIDVNLDPKTNKLFDF